MVIILHTTKCPSRLECILDIQMEPRSVLPDWSIYQTSKWIKLNTHNVFYIGRAAIHILWLDISITIMWLVFGKSELGWSEGRNKYHVSICYISVSRKCKTSDDKTDIKNTHYSGNCQQLLPISQVIDEKLNCYRLYHICIPNGTEEATVFA
jgi:hypothetical protein